MQTRIWDFAPAIHRYGEKEEVEGGWSPEFDTLLCNLLFLLNRDARFCHYKALVVGVGKPIVSKSSCCSGLRVVTPEADWR